MYSHLELTKREWEVLMLLAKTGMSRNELAAELHVSDATIDSHLRSIYSKLEVSNCIQAVIYVYRNNILEKIT